VIWIAPLLLMLAGCAPMIAFLLSEIEAVQRFRWKLRRRKSPGDVLIEAAIVLLDTQPLAWHESSYAHLAHPEGFVISRHSLEYNRTNFMISSLARTLLDQAWSRRLAWLQQYREAQALGIAA
jgi:hypothetical protein